jgi:hypothetical protein
LKNDKSQSLLTNRLYDQLKFVALVVLPFIGVAYYLLGVLADFPNAEETVATILAIDLILGALVNAAAKGYYKREANFDGEVLVAPEDGGVKTTFVFNEMPEDMVLDETRRQMSFLIKRGRIAG